MGDIYKQNHPVLSEGLFQHSDAHGLIINSYSTKYFAIGALTERWLNDRQHKIKLNSIKLENISVSVVSRKCARLKIQGMVVQTRPRSMDFSERINPEYKSSGKDFKLRVPSLRFQAR